MQYFTLFFSKKNIFWNQNNRHIDMQSYTITLRDTQYIHKAHSMLLHNLIDLWFYPVFSPTTPSVPRHPSTSASSHYFYFFGRFSRSVLSQFMICSIPIVSARNDKSAITSYSSKTRNFSFQLCNCWKH